MSTCNDDNDNDADGVWTDRAPVCRPITCNPEHVDPADGMVDCTNGNFVGSTCTYVMKKYFKNSFVSLAVLSLSRLDSS